MLAKYFSRTGSLLAVAGGVDPARLTTDAPAGATTVEARGLLSAPTAGFYDIIMSSTARASIDGTLLQESSSATLELPATPVHVDFSTPLGHSDPFAWRRGDDDFESIGRDALTARSLSLPKPDDPFPTVASHLGREVGETDPPDSDRDGIPDTWEVDGYTVEQSSTGVSEIVEWDRATHEGQTDEWGRPFVRYVTSPQKSSTSGDPYTDFQKVTGVQMDPRVAELAQHPLVTAYPDVAIDMTRYRLIADTQWSESTGGSNQHGVSQTTSSTRSQSETVGGEVSCSASLLDFGCSASVSYSTTTETTAGNESAASNSTSAEWNALLSGSNARAAIMLPNIFYENVGTAPISNAYPLFTVRLGDESLVSATSNSANRLVAANPGETYPRGDTALAFERVNDFNSVISFDRDAVESLRDYDLAGTKDLRIVTTGVDAPVVLIDTNGDPYESSTTWENQLSVIRSTTAEIVVDDGDGRPTTRRVAAPGLSNVERTVPQLTVGEALQLSYGATKRAEKYYIDGQEVSPSTHSVIASETTASDIADQKAASLFDVKLKAGMQLTLDLIERTEELPDRPTFTAHQWATTTSGFTGCGGSSPSCTLELVPDDVHIVCDRYGHTDRAWRVFAGNGSAWRTPRCSRADPQHHRLYIPSGELAVGSVIAPGTPIRLERDGVAYRPLPAPAPEPPPSSAPVSR